ncbi:LysR family transcriptional regulator [Acidocella sp.]|uniref:LysR family transcriptional regulator n=1 Tax=Acidocella sp. TaxID=50710 RepID=UPI002601D78D|nr:LysR family transcriptional regulator [Acidocella sp.]
MEIRQLRQFAAVADTLHFGRAAQRLNMTQPPLSQSIQALERELGSALFIRTKRSVSLSPFGIAWLAHVRVALAGVDALPETAHRLITGTAGRLSLSFVSTADYSLLPLLVRHFSTLYPEVEITLTEATSDVQITLLQEGSAHAGIIIAPKDEALPAVLTYRRLLREKLVAAVPEDWITTGRLFPGAHGLAPQQVIEAPLIIFPQPMAPSFYDLVLGYYRAHGAEPRIAQPAIQMQTIISLVSAGLGLALVPASLRHLARTGVRYLDLQGDAPVLETGLAWRRDETAPVLARLLDVAADIQHSSL